MSGVTAASVIRAGLAAGQSVSEILDEVRAAVPGSRADASHVAYYRSKARRAAASELSARPAEEHFRTAHLSVGAKIVRLTAAQSEALDKHVSRWAAVASATDPCDRATCEAAADLAYRLAGLAPPALKVWRGSALAGAEVAAGLDKGRGGQVADYVFECALGSVAAQAKDATMPKVRSEVSRRVADASFGSLAVRRLVERAVRGESKLQYVSCADVERIAPLAFYGEALGLRCADRLAGLAGLATCGYWWPFRNVVVLTERPSSVRADAASRPHAASGPAVAYPDGSGIYAWHGTAVPREWIESKPEDLDPMLALVWSNLEQRRCLAEIVGWARVLEKLAPRVVDRHPDPEVGTLLEADLPTGDRFVRTAPQRFLLVKCGTGRTFALPVPREVQTALAANAWTYGLEASEYAPEYRT